MDIYYKYNKYKNKYNNLKTLIQNGGGILFIHKTGEQIGSPNIIKTNIRNIQAGIDFKTQFTKKPFDDAVGRKFYNKIITSNGNIYPSNQSNKKTKINLTVLFDKYYTDNDSLGYGLEVDEDVYKAFEYLCAHSQQTKVFNKCGNMYQFN